MSLTRRPVMCQRLIGLVGLIGLFVVGVSTPSPVQAILMTVDDPVFGPSSLLWDTDTNLEWLRFDEPENFSGTWNEWDTAIGTDPLYAAFHLGASAEIRTLWDHGSVPADTPFGGFIPPASFDAAIPFVDLIGGSHNPPLCDSTFTSCSIQANAWRNEVQSYAAFSISLSDGVIGSVLNPLPEDFVRGGWIARTAVPEPDIALLHGAALGVLTGLAHWRRSRRLGGHLRGGLRCA